MRQYARKTQEQDMKPGKTNKQLYLSIVLFHCLCTLAYADPGLLWKVEKDGTVANYVFGTIHSDDPAITTLPYQVERVFSHARSFTIELDMDLSTILHAQTLMLLPAEKDLSRMLGEQRYKKCISLMEEHGVPEMLVMRMKPWAIATQLSMPKPTTGVFLDLKMYQQAQAKGIPTYGLETIQEQTDVFDKMTTEQQITILDEAMENYKDLPDMISTLKRQYLQRDLDGMQAFSEKYMKKGDANLAGIVQQKLVYERNYRMVERMQIRFKEGGAFIAIGALHLPGDKGVLNLLRQKGYRVEAVY